MRIVFDISTSIAWRRPPIGILRPEKALLRFLLDAIANGDAIDDFAHPGGEAASRTIAFCRFDKEKNDYFYVPPALAERTLTIDWDDSAQSTQFDVEMRVAQEIEAAWGGFLPVPLKESLRQWLPRSFISASQGSAIAPLAYIGTALKAVAPPQSGIRKSRRQAEVIFSQHDTYLSVGLDWDFNNYAHLYRRKTDAQFKCVLCCFDLVPILFPQLTTENTARVFPNHLVNLCHTADTVLSISETTSRDLAAFISNQEIVPVPEISTVFLGDNALTTGPRKVAILEGERFFAYVSTIEARKNHATLLRAWEMLADDQTLADAKLVLVGMPGWGIGTLLNDLATNLKLRSRTIVLANLADAELAWIYRNCDFTVFPSLYEGWGLAASESLRFGKPVLISTAPSLIEATQGLMPAIDPNDVEGWSTAISSLLRDDVYRATLTAAIDDRYVHYSWVEYFAGVKRAISWETA